MWLILNTAILLPGLLWATVRAISKEGGISTHLLAWGATLIFLFVWPWTHWPAYTEDFAFNMILTAGLIGLYAGQLLIRSVGLEDFGRRGTKHLPPSVVVAGTAIYALYWAYQLFETLRSAGSFRGALAISRAELHLTSEYFSGRPILELAMAIPGALFWIGLQRTWVRSKILFFLLLGMLVLAEAVTFATRFTIAAQLAAVLVFSATYRYHSSVRAGTALSESSRGRRGRHKGIILLAAAFLLVVGIQYVLNYVRIGAVEVMRDPEFWSVGRLIDATLGDVRYYAYLHDLYFAIARGDLDFDYGAAMLYNLASLIPRRLWPEKPVTATSVRLTQELHGPVGAGQPIYTYTIFGEGYFEAGYLGAFLAPIVFLWAYSLLLRTLAKIQDTALLGLFWMFMMIASFRAEFPFAVLVTNFVVVGGMMLLCRREAKLATRGKPVRT